MSELPLQQVLLQVSEHRKKVEEAINAMCEEWLLLPGLPGILVTTDNASVRMTNLANVPGDPSDQWRIDLPAVTIEWSEDVPAGTIAYKEIP